MFQASQVALVVKNPPANTGNLQEMRVRSLGQKDPLEEGMATHSSLLSRRIPTDRGAWWATFHGVTKSRTWLKKQHACMPPFSDCTNHPFPLYNLHFAELFTCLPSRLDYKYFSLLKPWAPCTVSATNTCSDRVSKWSHKNLCTLQFLHQGNEVVVLSQLISMTLRSYWAAAVCPHSVRSY